MALDQSDHTGNAPLEPTALRTEDERGAALTVSGTNLHNLALQFNPAEFMQFVEDEGLSEEEAVALLRAIWDIVVAFVDLGFGLNPVQQALVDRSRMNVETRSPRVPDRVSSKEEFSKIANNKPAGRFYRGSAMPEES